MSYETVIGLETHAQLLTESKMFCSCSARFGAPPNTNICPVCTGQPGSLPVTNKKAVELAIKTALALNCKIEPSSIFARKHYFYPDLPKDYQISQYEEPLATGGSLKIEVDGQIRNIRITRVHLEEDAGKLVHVGAARIMGAEESLVDFNRTGTPLMEIVTEPDLRSPKEAAIYTETLANLLRWIEVCDARMEEGSLRCDANISIRPAGETKLGTKTEVKNMNSFKAIEKALISEEKRHREVLSEGGKIVQETRFFDDVTETTSGMRSKEEAHDYRYFPEPDLLPLEPPNAWVTEIDGTIGELPWEAKERFIGLGIPTETAQLLVQDKPMADFLDETIKLGAKAASVANWLVGEMQALYTGYLVTKLAGSLGKGFANVENFKEFFCNRSFFPNELNNLINQIEKGTINGTMAKKVIPDVLKYRKPVNNIIAESGFTQINDESELLKTAQEVVKNNPKQVEQYKGGKEAVMMFFVGQMMKATKGRANPELAAKLLKQALA